MPRLASAFDSPDQKRRYVRTLFATIADRYDFITIFLSFGRDRAWKRRLVLEAAVQCGERVLDLACGTGDIALALARHSERVAGLDVTGRMLELARSKAAAAAMIHAPGFVLGDMTALPIRSGSIDVVTVGYGLRNVPTLDAALEEIARVLQPRGRFLSLDFNRPASRAVRAVFLAYLTVVGAALGRVLHGDPDTYRYIPESIRRYPGAAGITAQLERHGFAVREIPLLCGLMTLHAAVRRDAPST